MDVEPHVQMIKEITVQPLQQVSRMVVHYLPQVLGALALLLAGWLAAVLLRKLTAKVLRAAGLDVIAERTGVTAILERGGIRKRPSELLGRGVYWLLIFSALMATFNALGLEIASMLLRAIALYIPSLLMALLLLGLGFLASRYVDTVVTAAAAALNMPFPHGWGRGAQTLILMLAAVMALSELGIATTMVSVGFVVFLGVAGTAAVVAFGLGAREVAAHLTAGQCLRQMLEVGDIVLYEGHEGTIQEIGLTHTSLVTAQGVLTIPNTTFMGTTFVKRLPTRAPVSVGRETARKIP